MSLPLRPKAGRKVLSGTTAERLTNQSVPCEAVALKAMSGAPEVGDSTVTAGNGWPLEEPVSIPVSDARNVYLIGASGNEVAWMVVAP